MRYMMQFAVMLSDIILLIALVVVWMTQPFWFAIIMTWLAFRAWNVSGGFMAWQPKWIKRFLGNAKEIGL